MKVFYHDDLDGRCAASIIAICLGKKNPEDFVAVDYSKPFPFHILEEYDDLYMVDLSLDVDRALKLRDVIYEKNVHVVWIDHHETSVNTMISIGNDPDDPYPKSLGTIMIRGEKAGGIECEEEIFLGQTWLTNSSDDSAYPISAALMTWTFFAGNGTDEICLEGPIINLPKDLPRYVRLISDYDTWQLSPEVLPFKLGMDAMDTHPLAAIWETLYNNAKSDQLSATVDNIIRQGKSVQGYMTMEHREYLKSYCYLTDVDGIECMVVNRKGNSLLFGDDYGSWPLHMTWVFNGQNYQFSIFSKDPNINCREIAERYGGGGHAQAAGFVLDHMPFYKVYFH